MFVFSGRVLLLVLASAGVSCGGSGGENDDDDGTTSSAAAAESSTTAGSGEQQTGGTDAPCFSAWQQVTADGDFSPTLTADVDGDARADVVMVHEQQVRIYLGSADGSGVAAPIDYTLEYPSNGARLLPTDPGQAPRLLLSSYAGTANAFDIVRVVDGAVTRTLLIPEARRIYSGDFDGDGTSDAIVLNRDLEVDVYLGAADGSLTWAASMLHIWLTTLDIDGDGRTDLLDAVGSDLWFQRSRGDGTFETKEQLGVGFEDNVVDATAVTLDADPAVLVHLERAGPDPRDAAFAVVARAPDGTWTERARTPWVGDSWLQHVAPLPDLAPLAFVSQSFSDFGSDAFVLSPSGAVRSIELVSFLSFVAELDGVDPPELIDAGAQGLAALTSADEAWDTRVELDHVGYIAGTGDFDGDGLDDLLTRDSDGIALRHNEGCLVPGGD